MENYEAMENENLELPEDIEEFAQEPEEETVETLEQPAEQTPKAEESVKEPGYVQGRIAKAVEKAVAETEARMKAMFEEQMAPFRERQMEDEAQELVRTRKVADIEMARELVRLRNGQPQPKPKEQPRQTNGQFAPKEDAVLSARKEILRNQAEKIKASTGVDVIKECTDEEIRAKVLNGEMDFYEVAELLKEQKSKKRPPSPTRSPNGVSNSSKGGVWGLSDAEFAQMEKNIDAGVTYRQR